MIVFFHICFQLLQYAVLGFRINNGLYPRGYITHCMWELLNSQFVVLRHVLDVYSSDGGGGGRAGALG